MVYFCQPELPFDTGFCEVMDHILPMIFGLAGDGLDQLVRHRLGVEVVKPDPVEVQLTQPGQAAGQAV